ncbi:MAG: universal stress protein [Thermoleophilia bacterium]|nr:universal stress protein [Thermoleophilia bacterium]
MREQADLVAAGTHGKNRRAGIALGIVATTILNETQCPVLVARPAAPASAFPSAIVVGLDRSRESAEAANVAAAFADRFGASLRVLAACPASRSWQGFGLV